MNSRSVIAFVFALFLFAEIRALLALTVFSKLHLPQAIWAEAVEQGRVSTDSLADLQITLHLTSF
jgi:hypothetical protein